MFSSLKMFGDTDGLDTPCRNTAAKTLTLLAKDSPQLQSTQSNSPLALDALVTRAAQAMQIKAATLVGTMRIQPVRLAGRASFHSGHLKQTGKSTTMETRTPVTELKKSLVRLHSALSLRGRIVPACPSLVG